MALNYFFTVIFIIMGLSALLFGKVMYSYFLKIVSNNDLSKKVGLALGIPGLALLLFILNI